MTPCVNNDLGRTEEKPTGSEASQVVDQALCARSARRLTGGNGALSVQRLMMPKVKVQRGSQR